MRAYFIALVASLASFTSATSQTSSTGETSKTCLLFTGDILLDRGVRKVIGHHGIDHLFTREMDSLFRASQVVVGNAPVQKRFIFQGEPAWLGALKKHGFTHLNLANNHSTDQGRKGLTDTGENILKARMKPVGMGKNLQEAAQPVLLTSQPRKVWLIASLGMALENFAYLPDRPCVNTERTQHWGGEHTLKPVPSQRLDAHRLINAGADALICHHTHTLQTIEHYKGRDIYYSIGNFIFDQQKPLNSKACVVKVEVTMNHVKTQALPVHIQGCIPHLK